MIEELQKIPTDIVQRFLETRNAESCGIPKRLAEYVLQLNDAANLFKKNSSISVCANNLQKLHSELSISTCRQRVFDSINYLHADCSVTSESWNMYFADEMMKLRDVNLIARNFKEARVCMDRARQFRIDASSHAINPNLLKFKPQIVSPDVELERMGVKKKGLLAAYRRGIDIINKRDIKDSDKKRMIEELEHELNIEDTNYESAED
jgi:hypothetical protein